MTEPDNVMYLLFREDLPMSKGKVAAQAAHAAQLMVEELLQTEGNNARWARYTEWKKYGITKVALRVPDLAALNDLRLNLRVEGVWTTAVVDEGRTEVPPNSLTCVATEPRDRGFMRQFVGKLPLL